MASPYEHIPDEVKRSAAEHTDEPPKKKAAASSGKKTQPAAPEEHPQRRIFKKKRAGVVLSREEVKAIREGRKKLRKEMRARGLKSKRDFELTAGSLGLYFDKRNWGILAWLWGHWLGALIGLLIALMFVLMVFSMVQHLRGHFTVNLSDGMFRKGFSMSETVGFEHPTTQLFARPAEDVPCISITQLPLDLDEIDGAHNDAYFAYTFYLRNESDENIDYVWSLNMNSETQSVSDAAWLLLFCDGEMYIYANPNAETGEPEAIPAFTENHFGYIDIPIQQLAADPDQFQIVATVGRVTYWRVVPHSFVSDVCVVNGKQSDVAPQEVHKYTVVIWLEGDDEDVTDKMIGGHLGVEMDFMLQDEADTLEGSSGGAGDPNAFGTRWRQFWDSIWSSLRFY